MLMNMEILQQPNPKMLILLGEPPIIENQDLWEECKKFELSNLRLNGENDMHKEFKEIINNLKNKKK